MNFHEKKRSYSHVEKHNEKTKYNQRKKILVLNTLEALTQQQRPEDPQQFLSKL